VRVHAIVEDIETARRAVVAGATVLQLRVKGSTAEVVARGQGFRALGTTFVVNDDVDAALELGADGVHLGQSDSGADRARARGLLLGRSAVTFDQAVAADADYLGVGPIWPTPSKPGAPTLGPAALGMPFTPLPVASIVLRVADFDEARAKLEAAGVELLGDVIDSGVCRMQPFTDTEGNGLMLHNRYAPYPDGTMP